MAEFDDFDGTTGELRDKFEAKLAERNKQLEDAKKEAAEAQEAAKVAAQAKRELAFVKAGIDPDDEKMKYFVKGYEGELDSAKIKEAAEAAGFLTKADSGDSGKPDDKGDQIPDSEAEALAAMDGVTASGTAHGGSKDAETVKGMKEIFEKGGDTQQVAQFLGSQGVPVAEGYE